jgi:predicted enzyme related to lactoylglutathione lyase
VRSLDLEFVAIDRPEPITESELTKIEVPVLENVSGYTSCGRTYDVKGPGRPSERTNANLCTWGPDMNQSDTATAQLTGLSPAFFATDLKNSAEYYRDALGFQIEQYWGEPPCFVIVSRDGVQIMLRLRGETIVQPSRKWSAEAWDAYIYVRNLDSYIDDLKSRKAKILKGPETTSYGMLEVQIEDPDGYVLCFGQDVANERQQK